MCTLAGSVAWRKRRPEAVDVDKCVMNLDQLAILGYGHFGRALGELALDAGLEVRAWDPVVQVESDRAAASVEDLVGSGSVVILAVPVGREAGALESLRGCLTGEHLVLDVASVKRGSVEAMERVLGADVPWCATHPLFGPASIARGERPLRAVVCPNGLHAGAAGEARGLYERLGCDVIEQDADEHDKVMAHSHALAFFVAKAMLEIGAGEIGPSVPPSFAAMAQTIETVRADAGHLFYPIQAGNPHAGDAREKLLDAMLRIHRGLADGVGVEDVESVMEIPARSGPPPELLETRDLIDELDRELLRLLAQRAQLSHRAMRAKAGAGRGVHDPKREEELLGKRRDWGEAFGLSGDGIGDVFEAVLRFSRGEQRRGTATERRSDEAT